MEEVLGDKEDKSIRERRVVLTRDEVVPPRDGSLGEEKVAFKMRAGELDAAFGVYGKLTVAAKRVLLVEVVDIFVQIVVNVAIGNGMVRVACGVPGEERADGCAVRIQCQRTHAGLH